MNSTGFFSLCLIASITTFAQLPKKHERFLQEYVVVTPFNKSSGDFLNLLSLSNKTKPVHNLSLGGRLQSAGSFDPQLLPLTGADHVFFEIRKFGTTLRLFDLFRDNQLENSGTLATYVVEYRFADTLFTIKQWGQFIKENLKSFARHFQRTPFYHIPSGYSSMYFTSRDGDLLDIELYWPYDRVAKQYILRITIPFWWQP